MFKETKRKGFNFFRSYYDVFNELETDKDKLAFIEALLDRQFLGVKPEGLKGLVKFAWISQVNSIDSQVKGYEDKTKTKLTPTEGGAARGNLPPTAQVEEKEKEKEKKVNSREKSFDVFWKLYPKKVAKEKCKSKFMKLSDADLESIKRTLKTFIAYKPFEDYTHPHPMTYLNQKRWNDELAPKEKEKTKQEIFEERLAEVFKNKKQ